ncbi:MAG TPA: hypothetical protein VK672_00060 [Solirubrobacteraceae bacterium]|jgi:hypothetical protein|nr:hypothetical protein [Solirubrobacteraceae bacterium]
MLGFLALALTLTAAPSAASAQRVIYYENHFQPSRIVVHQGGNYHQVSINGLTWTRWNQPAAVGRGTYTFQFCAPETGPCADAAFYDTPVLVKLSAIATCKGRASYTRLDVASASTVPNTLVKPFHINARVCAGRRHAGRKH